MLKKIAFNKIKNIWKIKNLVSKNEKGVFSLKTNNILEYTFGFPKIDSYWVTVVFDRNSWGTISCIQRFDSIQNV